MTSLITLSFLTIIGLMGLVQSLDFQSNRAIGSMIYFLSGRSPSDFVNYGCWCSNKDRPTHAPVDEIDQCCQTNMECHLENSGRTVASASYPYKTSFEDGTIECINNEKTYAYRQCQCDLVLAQCVNKHLNVYTHNLLHVSNDKCSPGVILGFDDFPFNNASSQNLPSNYHNLSITGGSYMFANRYLPRQSGYTTAMVSSPNILTSQQRITIKRVDSQPFTVLSFHAAAAWTNDIQLNLVGSRQYSPLLFNETVQLRMTNRTFVQLNWSGIDTLTMNATDGRQLTSYVLYPETLFAIDDLRVRF